MGNLSKSKTRKELIDPALKKAGWDINNLTQVGLEIPVDGSNVEAWQKLEKKLNSLKESGGQSFHGNPWTWNISYQAAQLVTV